jgi:UDP-2,3-diacylglucosamine pyrophosphatase LpxH
MKQKYNAVFISDIHLGAPASQAGAVLAFLKTVKCRHLFLVGDIIDGWKLKQKFFWNNTYNELIRHILKMQKNGTKVIYLTGNHDEFLREWLEHVNIISDTITIADEYEYHSLSGKKYLVVHGDLFDGVHRLAKWISYLGDWAYSTMIVINRYLNDIRRSLGLGYWSLSAYLKHNVKRATSFIFSFEENLAQYAKVKECDGVICGHIHTAAIKTIDDIEYMNCGDWVESCTALVETEIGEFKIVKIV